jgi:hypothetical protein
MAALSKMGGTPVLRMAINKAGPVVTDNGTFNYCDTRNVCRGRSF